MPSPLRCLALLACALVGLGCSRDLALPIGVPPVVDTFGPTSGFAGERVTLHGGHLGNALTAQVTFGGVAAQIVGDSGDAETSLVVLVPEQPLGTSLPLTVRTGPNNPVATQGNFTYRGLGHPVALGVSALYSLVPQIAVAAPVADQVLLVDSLHGLLLRMDTGGALAAPFSTAAQKLSGTLLPFGSDGDHPWLYASGSSTDGPSLVPFDFSGPLPVAGTRLALSGATAGAAGLQNPVASADGTQLLVPAGGAVLLWVQLVAGSAVQQAITLSGAAQPVLVAAFAAPTTVVGLTGDQPFRIELGSGAPQVVLGAAPTDANALPAAADPTQALTPSVSLAVDPVARRAVYLRRDGDLGLFTWGAAPGMAPVLSASTIPTFAATPRLLAFTSDPTAPALVAADPVQGQLVAYGSDLRPGSASPISQLSSLLAVASGPAQGLLLTGDGPVGAELLSPSGATISTLVVHAGLPATGALGYSHNSKRLVLASALGPLVIDPDKLTSIPTGYFAAAGASTGDGQEALAWTGSDVRKVVNATSTVLATAPTGRLVRDAVLTPEGYVAVATCSPNQAGTDCLTSGTFDLELLPRQDASPAPPPPPAPLSWTIPHKVSGTIHGLLRVANGKLYALTSPAGKLHLSRFSLGTLTEELGSDLQGDFFRGLWYSRALGGTVAASSSTTASNLLLLPDGGAAPKTAALVRPFQNPVALSADGVLLVSASTGDAAHSASVDSARLFVAADGTLQLETQDHADLPGRPGTVIPSEDGARFFAAIPHVDVVAELQ